MSDHGCYYCGALTRDLGRHNGPGGHLFIPRWLILGKKAPS